VPEECLPGVASRVRAAPRNEGRNRGDVERRERGYYERLLGTGRGPGDAAEAEAVPFGDGPLAVRVEDVREYVLKPGLATMHEGARGTTNSAYRAIVEDCRARGVPSVWVLVPRVGRAIEPRERRRLLGLTRDAGFSAVLDLSDVYTGIDPAALGIGPDDYHPNAEGHARLSLRLAAALAGRSAPAEAGP
jgi:hypothetical protein